MAFLETEKNSGKLKENVFWNDFTELSERHRENMTGSLLTRTKERVPIPLWGANSYFVHVAQVTTVLARVAKVGSVDLQGHPGAGNSAYQREASQQPRDQRRRDRSVPLAKLYPYHQTSESGIVCISGKSCICQPWGFENFLEVPNPKVNEPLSLANC